MSDSDSMDGPVGLEDGGIDALVFEILARFHDRVESVEQRVRLGDREVVTRINFADRKRGAA